MNKNRKIENVAEESTVTESDIRSFEQEEGMRPLCSHILIDAGFVESKRSQGGYNHKIEFALKANKLPIPPVSEETAWLAA